MEHLIRGVRDAVAKESWYAALALALALPDTCASIEQPGKGKSRTRFTAWVDKYVAKHSRDEAGTAFLKGSDLYLLRCAFLHEGSFEIDDGPVDSGSNTSAAIFSVLNRIHLWVSDYDVIPTRGMSEVNKDASTRATNMILSPKTLCEWICLGAEEWLPVARTDSKQAALIEKLGRIERFTDSGGLTEL